MGGEIHGFKFQTKPPFFFGTNDPYTKLQKARYPIPEPGELPVASSAGTYSSNPCEFCLVAKFCLRESCGHGGIYCPLPSYSYSIILICKVIFCGTSGSNTHSSGRRAPAVLMFWSLLCSRAYFVEVYRLLSATLPPTPAPPPSFFLCLCEARRSTFRKLKGKKIKNT